MDQNRSSSLLKTHILCINSKTVHHMSGAICIENNSYIMLHKLSFSYKGIAWQSSGIRINTIVCRNILTCWHFKYLFVTWV